MNKMLMMVFFAVGMLHTLFAAIPLDGRVYDEYLKTQPGKERKAFLREAFGGGQFDMRDLFEMVATTEEGDWAFTAGKNGERYAIRLWQEKERGVRTLNLPEAFAGSVTIAVRLASGAESPVMVVNGIPTFELAPDDRADSCADAFEIR